MPTRTRDELLEALMEAAMDWRADEYCRGPALYNRLAAVLDDTSLCFGEHDAQLDEAKRELAQFAFAVGQRTADALRDQRHTLAALHDATLADLKNAHACIESLERDLRSFVHAARCDCVLCVEAEPSSTTGEGK